MNYVYIILCGDNTLYTGWTNDLHKRFKEHSSGKGAKYTRGRGPLELIYYEEYNDKSQAMKREYEIKQLTKVQKEELVKDFSKIM
jgi:putative endonuclease